jgi:hypothetical protein
MGMKEDKLEKFVAENREEFNNLEAPPSLWQAIEREIAPTGSGKKLRFGSIAWKAAAAILIFASAWYLNDYFDSAPHTKQAKAIEHKTVSSPALNELSDAEAYYTSQINSRQAELAQYAREHPKIIADLKKEFHQMDLNNVQLNKDLAESNADEKVIEAIMQSYRVKLEILEQMLLELRKSKGGPPQPSINL